MFLIRSESQSNGVSAALLMSFLLPLLCSIYWFSPTMHHLKNLSVTGVSLALGLSAFGIITQPAQAQRPALLDCDLTNLPNGAPRPNTDPCVQGQGATFAFQAVLETLRASEANVYDGGAAGNRVNGFPPVNPPNASLLPNRVNYASRGSGSAVDGISDIGCLDTSAALAAAGLSGERAQSDAANSDSVQEPPGQGCAFFLSEAPFASEVDLLEYYVQTDRPSLAALPNTFDSAYELGFGRLVQLPAFGGLVTIAFNINAVNTPAEEQLTDEEYCTLFNGSAVSGVPGFNGATGVVRSDGSGTTFAFSGALEARCTPLGLWETPSGDPRGSGEDGLRDTTSAEVGAGSTSGDVVTVNGTPLCETSAAQRAGAVTNTGEDAENFVCWPSSVLGGDGNDGVSDQVSAANGRYGYVELAQATADGLDTATVENPNSGTFFEPTGQAGATALDLNINDSLAAGVSVGAGNANNSDFCALTFDTTDPADGYPFVSLVYFYTFSDHFADGIPTSPALYPNPNPPNLANPNPSAGPAPLVNYLGGPAGSASVSSALRGLVLSLTAGPLTTPGKSALAAANYVPLGPSFGTAITQRAQQCINVQ